MAHPAATSPQQSASPIDLSKHQIETLAEQFSRKSGYLENQDLPSVVQKLGGKIEVTDFWENESTGSLLVFEPKHFVIRIPKHTTRERDRFTIAHELGHYVLHYLLADKHQSNRRMVADRYGSGLVEWQANWFAASFLMPRTEFEAQFSKEADQFSVAKKFGVSIPAVRTRAKALGISDR